MGQFGDESCILCRSPVTSLQNANKVNAAIRVTPPSNNPQATTEVTNPEKRANTLLLTGASGVGKTTVIRKVADGLRGREVRGFITEEIREAGKRVGFRLDTFDGRTGILAHTNVRSQHRLGKYGVDLAALDRIVESELNPNPGIDVYLIDEIGKMECFSLKFVSAMTALLDSGHRIVATIHRSSGGFIGQVKRRPDVDVWEVTLDNRDGIVGQVVDWISV